MRLAVLAFALGVWLLQRQPALPEWQTVSIVLACAFCAPGLCRCGRPMTIVAVLLAGTALGFAWAAGAAKLRMTDRITPEWESRDVTLTGVIASLPQPFERGVRFDFDVEAVEPREARVPSRVALAWYNGFTREEFQDVQPVRAGERWRFAVRLKRPHGNANPHGFDYEAWLLERGIGATGYVRPRGERERLAELVHAPGYWIERMRELLRAKFWNDLPEHRYAGVLIALAIGDQRAIDSADWEVFTRTGVGHLMSISGLHVTMVAGLFGLLVQWLWRRSTRLALALPARKAAAMAGVAAAFAYCLLAGFGVPAQRTLYMLTVVAVALWLDRWQSSSRVLCLALAVVLLLDPWAVTAAGFWLSFGAVALMFYVGAGAASHRLVQWGRVQWAITVGLAPLMLVLFQQVSLISPVANAVAIPLVSFVVTPLALLGALTPGPWVALIAHAVLEALMTGLELLVRLPMGVWQQHAPAPWTAVMAMLGVAWMLAPRGVPARYAGVLLLLPMFSVVPSPPGPGEMRIAILDVGQGLAVVVRTHRHALLYDAGPAYSVDADAGSRVVIPYLRGEGIAELDAVVVSHNDNDHSGGAASVMRGVPARVLWSSLDAAHPAFAHAPYRLPCRAGVRWEWDGVRFELLHPHNDSYADAALRPNSRSCVLHVVSAHGSALLTGDIEERDEKELLTRAAPLRATLLTVPHHGSRTSSTQSFVAAVAPLQAVVAAGYRNRFGHPRADVIARYTEAGAIVSRTDRDGAVTFEFTPTGVSLRRYRDSESRYWR